MISGSRAGKYEWYAARVVSIVRAVTVTTALGAETISYAEKSLFEAANRERKAQGLSLLKWNEALAKAARAHALEMARHNLVAHRLPGEPTLPARATRAGAHFRSLSGNVVKASSAAAAHSQFMHSAAHR